MAFNEGSYALRVVGYVVAANNGNVGKTKFLGGKILCL